MSLDNLSLILDVVILFGLATTIYFALRLSQSLGRFRKQRHDFEKIMRHLNDNIERAHVSLAELKGFSGSFDQDVQDSLREAKDLLDELKMINHSGNNLADRLESLASHSAYIGEAKAAQGAVHDLRAANGDVAGDDVDYDQKLYDSISAIEGRMGGDDSGAGAAGAAMRDGFSIQDRDYGQGAGAASGDVVERRDESSGRSRAEQDLMDALARRQGAV